MCKTKYILQIMAVYLYLFFSFNSTNDMFCLSCKVAVALILRLENEINTCRSVLYTSFSQVAS